MVPAETKALIIALSIPRLANGESTEAIAKEHGITGRTLRYWLVNDESALEARTAFLSEKLMAAAEEMEAATDVFPLARARETFKAYSWIAERRLPNVFGQRQQVEHKHTLDVTQALEDARQALNARRVIDVTPTDT